jgi:hypothetical protein
MSCIQVSATPGPGFFQNPCPSTQNPLHEKQTVAKAHIIENEADLPATLEGQMINKYLLRTGQNAGL